MKTSIKGVVNNLNRHKKIIILLAIPLILLLKIIDELVEMELSAFDEMIYGFVSGYISSTLTEFMKFLSLLGSGPIAILIAATALLVYWKSDNYSFYSKIIALNLPLSSAINTTIKYIFQRERPDIHRLVDITGFSFPSGHSMVSMSFYGLIAYTLYISIKSRWRYVAIIALGSLIILIGISRIYLGVHYASDVAAGFCVGLLWAISYTFTINIIYANKMQKGGNS